MKQRTNEEKKTEEERMRGLKVVINEKKGEKQDKVVIKKVKIERPKNINVWTKEL